MEKYVVLTIGNDEVNVYGDEDGDSFSDRVKAGKLAKTLEDDEIYAYVVTLKRHKE